MPAASYVLNAIRWAESQLGSTAYRFRCLAFVEDCFEKGNSIEISGGSWANESAGMYGAGSGGEPDPGAFVFYGCFGTIDQTYRNWGHVGLCVVWKGEPRLGYREDGRLSRGGKPGTGPGMDQRPYCGWVPAGGILQGHQKR
ncbi:MAG: hypothetical protein AB1445_15950 [Bacillota bacterium]